MKISNYIKCKKISNYIKCKKPRSVMKKYKNQKEKGYRSMKNKNVIELDASIYHKF
jgi:hypothetical protein